MNRLTEQQKARLMVLFEEGRSVRGISEEINLPKSTIQDLKQKWQNTGSLNRLPGSGRKRISTEEQDTRLVTFLENHPFETAVEARRQTDFPGSVRVARRRVKERSGLRNRAAVKKPFLTTVNKEQRVGFALQYLQEGLGFWRNVVFTDEKTFQSCYNGRLRVYRPRNTRFEEKYTQTVKTSGRFSVNVWGYMTARGLGLCHRINGRFTAEVYSDILENVMLPSVSNIFPQRNFIYQHDNCPVHTARRILDWMRENDVNLLPWPSRSPDVNPIENVWGHIVKTMNRANDFRPHNSEELWNKIQEIWNTFTADYFQTLIASMPKRLELLIDKNGAGIKY